jgi:N-acetylated-alpha-linked acidic dipeptidase
LNRITGFSLAAILLLSTTAAKQASTQAQESARPAMLGFLDPAREAEIDRRFLAVPDPRLAEEHLRVLASAPHVAGTPEDRKTADYVAQKFREAGLETEIVEYKVWLPFPSEVRVDVVAPKGVVMHGPTRERTDDDAYQADPRVIAAFNAYAPSGDVEADVVYANYGRPEDFDTLAQMNVDVRGKIVLVRYGETYRGVKPFVAQQRGAAGVIIYSDPQQDGYFRGDTYPKGPWRPPTSVQRGSIGYMFEFPGDPTTPGIASLPSLAASKRTAPQRSAEMPKIPATPLSAEDAAPILQNLAGTESPRAWQGGLPFTYHVGPGPARVRIHLKHDDAYRSIWNVIGTVRGSEFPDEWVIAGNHRDAWAYGAVDPSSGTAAMLEAVHGIGALLKSGWRPKRTIVFGSWDAEEWGLIGSVEWVEQHEVELANGVAYLNMDTAVSGPRFGASAVPTLKEFLRDIARIVPAADGQGTVYDAWQRTRQTAAKTPEPQVSGGTQRLPVVQLKDDVPVGDLGSGSDYTPFLQHMGMPATDITSSGSYGVYHSVFDNLAWFRKFGDPEFRYEQQMARIFGLEAVHLADADVLPFEYESYGREIEAYIQVMRKRAEAEFGARAPAFAAAEAAAKRFTEAGAAIAAVQHKPGNNIRDLNRALREAERALLLPGGLPQRAWFRHTIYAPGRLTGYAAAVLPGVGDALESHDAAQAQRQAAALAEALNRAAAVLEKSR